MWNYCMEDVALQSHDSKLRSSAYVSQTSQYKDSKIKH